MTSRASWSWPTEEVVKAAQQGDTRAIAILLDGSHAHVHRFARTLCATPEDAEDVAGLPPEQRAVLVLRDIQSLSGAATSQALNLSRAAMKSRLHRGRETLRLRL